MLDDNASADLMRECHNLPDWARNDFWLLVISADRGEIAGVELIDAFTDLFQRARLYESARAAGGYGGEIAEEVRDFTHPLT